MSGASPRIRNAARGEAASCERILRSLPDWFGIESAIVSYRRDVESMETFVAEQDGAVAGFLTLRDHGDASAEVQVMAVRPGLHRRGLGRALVLHAEDRLRAAGREYLQVKTLAPSRESEHYERTRRFYEALGFRALEENDSWGPANPCLVLVKHLPCSPPGESRPGRAG